MPQEDRNDTGVRGGVSPGTLLTKDKKAVDSLKIPPLFQADSTR